jgi:hypothetical protein
MASITHWRRRINGNLLGDPVVAEALTPHLVEQYCREAGHRWRDSFWSPHVTLLTFLLQVLDPNKTLRSAVANLLTQLKLAGQSNLPSPDPSAYCQARQRLPGEAITRLMHLLAERVAALVRSSPAAPAHTDHAASASTASGSRWLGRRVLVVDGSSASMPDTPELQKAFPQPSGQAPGCGFPVAQVVTLFCWASGAIIDVMIDALRPHELTLFRQLWDYFAKDDVVLADRAYCNFVDVARLLKRGVHTVLRLHQRRRADFRMGRRLERDDRLVTWARPEQWLASCGISREEFEQLPETLVLRMVRIINTPRGFRSRTIVVVSTLTDPVDVPADELRALYRERWMAELNFRSLKVALGMDVLRGASRQVVIKEILMHVVTYNLIRLLMWHAAKKHGRDLHRLSFAGTLHRLQQAMPTLLLGGRALAADLLESLLLWIAADRVPDRPNRIEPRRRKRRPKQYSLLMKPRDWYKRRRDPHAR